MSEPIDTEGWQPLEPLSLSEMYLVEPGVLGVIPAKGTRDTEVLARAHLEGLERQCVELGGPHGVMVFFDQLAGQDAGARRVWSSADPRLIHSAALVCSSALARAIGSFYLGLRRPKMPTKVFGNADEAVAWLRERST